MLALHNASMLKAHAFTVAQFKAEDLFGLGRSELAEVAAHMLQHIGRQSQQIAERDRPSSSRAPSSSASRSNWRG